MGLHDRAAAVELVLPGDAVEASIERQLAREVARHGREAALARRGVYRQKAAVFQEDTRQAIELLAAAGLPRLRLDATLSRDEIHHLILEFAGTATRPRPAVLARVP